MQPAVLKWLRRLPLLMPWLGTWLVYRAAKRDRERADRILGEMSDIRFGTLEVRDSEIYATLKPGSLAVRLWAGIWLEMLDEADAENYIEAKLGASPDASDWVVVTVRRYHGMTPDEKCKVVEGMLATSEATVGQLRAVIKALAHTP